MSTNDRPTKRAKISEEEAEEEGCRGDNIDDLALTFSSALGLGGIGTGEAEAGDDDGEVPDLLIKILTFLAESKELVRSRAVCRVFRRWSDSIAKTQTAELIGPSIRPMAGQSVTALLHGAEQARGETKEKLRGWDAEVARAEGFDIGLPTYPVRYGSRSPDVDGYLKYLRGYDILAQIPIGDLAPGIHVPVGLQVGVRVGEDQTGDVVQGTKVSLPSGFFHINVYPSGTLALCSRVEFIRKERTLHDSLHRVQRDLLQPDWECPHSSVAYRLSNYGQDRNLHNDHFVQCCQIFSAYKLGRPIPPQFEAFRAEVSTKSKQLQEEQNAAQEE